MIKAVHPTDLGLISPETCTCCCMHHEEHSVIMCLMPQQTADSPASRRASPIPRMGVRLLLVVFIVKGTATSRWKVAELWPVFKKTRHKLKQWSKQLGSLLDLFDVRLVVPFSMALRLYIGSLCWYVRRLSVAGDKGELGDVSRQSEQDGHQQLVVVRLLQLYWLFVSRVRGTEIMPVM